MLANARRNRIVKKKIGIYVFLFGLLAILGFLIYLNILLKSSRFISPLGNSADFVKGQQIASLQRILRALTIEGKSFKNIDFRFKEPIISF